jgi:methylenetetrahydrofolate dehydrogenase (NADP+)/methenyltetrahydrofolate cyclohydrolase
MEAKLIDCKSLSIKLEKKIATSINERIKRGLRTGGLAVIIIGDNPASHIYVNKKHEACKRVGLLSYNYYFCSSVTEDKIIQLINELNYNPIIDGILIQLPLPKHINYYNIVNSISPNKDVDVLHPYNIGLLFLGNPILRPCTSKAVINILENLSIELSGLHVVIIGTSYIVGRPILLELVSRNATVTICNFHTKNLEKITKQADILISAVGKAKFIKYHWVKNNVIIIDVGISKNISNNIEGDVDYESVSHIAKYITPVPGGVGPMTVSALLENTFLALELNEKIRI